MGNPSAETNRTRPMVDLLSAVVCTLDPDEAPAQGLEWANVGAQSLATEQIVGGVAATFPLSLADAVEDLADRESSCCGSWLSVATERLGDTIQLEITTESPSGLNVILLMAGLA